ncbi:putative sporulation protein YtxC [Desulfolucanica intricata]|uniref:putative sporulation protein YtxC n=1 Tax=Desulfolucanica intricata TaxID=1285191 RepID=UPI00083093DF|nr:putative sporulation protein YtxC [Desulfolucanica intricata]
MAQGISIGAAQHIDVLKSKLNLEFRLLEGDGIDIKLEEKPNGNYTYLNCYVEEPCNSAFSQEDFKAIFNHYVADTISELILGDWERYFIKKNILEEYYYFDEEERNTIYKYALKFTHNNCDDTNGDNFYKLRKKTRIVNKLLDYLNQNDRINIDGFVKFRLKDYIRELNEAVEKAVDEFLVEREYKEFIQLLKYFVEIQEPRLELVHIIVQPRGVFKLLDDQHKVINSEYLDGFIVDLIDSEINYEDLLISALISIAPKKIIFHNNLDYNVATTLETIKNVFTGNVQECKGCELCSPNKQ